jgi:hypothetical protein
MKFKVELARLVREVKTVVVEAPSFEELDSRLEEVYDAEDGLSWEPDSDWGCDMGTHQILCPLTDEEGVTVDYVLPPSNGIYFP